MDGVATVPDNGIDEFIVRCNRQPSLTSAVGASPNFRAQLVGNDILERNKACWVDGNRLTKRRIVFCTTCSVCALSSVSLDEVSDNGIVVSCVLPEIVSKTSDTTWILLSLRVDDSCPEIKYCPVVFD